MLFRNRKPSGSLCRLALIRIVLLSVLVPATASAVSLAPAAAGKGIDFSSPLDGIADEVTPSTSTIDLTLNAFDANPSFVG